jgi:probable HAF family extracellular repeat protein
MANVVSAPAPSAIRTRNRHLPRGLDANQQNIREKNVKKMKKNLAPCFAALTLIAALTIPSAVSAQQPRYKLIDMGTFGGPLSSVNDGNSGNNAVSIVSNRGTLVGWADTSSPDPFPPNFCFNENCYVSHAFQWRDGVRTNLGALDESLSSQAVWISASGLIAGTSENGKIDPLFTGFPEFRAVLWRHSHITDLGTLSDGFESSANAVNSNGQVIGWAMNSTPDANSMAGPGFFPTQTRAFLWQKGAMQDLGTLGTGTDAIAQFLNERGQIVGWSYTGGTPPPTCIFTQATDSFIWDEKNGMIDLGNLGGTCVIATGINNDGVVIGDNVNDESLERAFIWKRDAIQDLGGSIGGQQTGAEAINESGQIAGFATLSGEVLFHAVLWNGVGEITDLGALGADECSFATAINSKTQVVGGSAVGCVFDSQSHAVLWEHGAIFDLNNLIARNASLTLELAQGINDRGEIAGIGVDAGGNEHAYLLVPCDKKSDCQEIVAGEATAAPPPVMERAPLANPRDTIRQMLRRQPGVRHFIPGPIGAASRTASQAASEEYSSSRSGQSDFIDEKILSHYGSGRCDTDYSTKKLTGYCTGSNGWVCFSRPSRQCPTGATAIHPEYVQMGFICRPYVDTARSCTF